MSFSESIYESVKFNWSLIFEVVEVREFIDQTRFLWLLNLSNTAILTIK